MANKLVVTTLNGGFKTVLQINGVDSVRSDSFNCKRNPTVQKVSGKCPLGKNLYAIVDINGKSSAGVSSDCFILDGNAIAPEDVFAFLEDVCPSVDTGGGDCGDCLTDVTMGVGNSLKTGTVANIPIIGTDVNTEYLSGYIDDGGTIKPLYYQSLLITLIEGSIGSFSVPLPVFDKIIDAVSEIRPAANSIEHTIVPQGTNNLGLSYPNNDILLRVLLLKSPVFEVDVGTLLPEPLNFYLKIKYTKP